MASTVLYVDTGSEGEGVHFIFIRAANEDLRFQL